MGHMGNLAAVPDPASGPAIVSNHVFIQWLDSNPAARGYLSPQSDLASLLVFDHQAHAANLITRLGWEARVADLGAGDALPTALRDQVRDLADYLLFVGEATAVVEVTPRPGFAEHLLARTPKDRRGRSLAELDLATRLLRYPCSYMVYTDAFDGLPLRAKDAVYRRMWDVLSGADADPRYAHLSAADRRAIREILRDTKSRPADRPRRLATGLEDHHDSTPTATTAANQRERRAESHVVERTIAARALHHQVGLIAHRRRELARGGNRNRDGERLEREPAVWTARKATGNTSTAAALLLNTLVSAHVSA